MDRRLPPPTPLDLRLESTWRQVAECSRALADLSDEDGVRFFRSLGGWDRWFLEQTNHVVRWELLGEATSVVRTTDFQNCEKRSIEPKNQPSDVEAPAAPVVEVQPGKDQIVEDQIVEENPAQQIEKVEETPTPSFRGVDAIASCYV